jgi:hypothetical protein
MIICDNAVQSYTKKTEFCHFLTKKAVEERYNVAGQRINSLQKGLNIIKLTNGKTVKLMVK